MNLLGSLVLSAFFYISSGLNTTLTDGQNKDDNSLAVILPVVTVIVVVVIIIVVVAVLKRYYSRLDTSRPKDINEVDMFNDSFLGLQASVENTHQTRKIYTKGGGKGHSTSTVEHRTGTVDVTDEISVVCDTEFTIPDYDWRDNKPRGLAVIIGVDEFNAVSYTNLAFVKKDKEMVKAMFKKLSFEVRECLAKEKGPIKDFLKKISDEDNSKYDCFACYISSHGDTNYVICKDADDLANNGMIEIRYIIGLFLNDTCTSFKKKPKLFFFDVCLGSNEINDADHASKGGHYARTFATDKDKLEAFEHILTIYATISGYVSYGGEDGSRFTKTLTHVINKSEPKHSMTDLVYAIHHRMSENDEKPAQIPTYSNKLVKRLFLKKDLNI